MKAHAKISPSMLPLLMKCAGSYNMQKDFPNTENAFSKEGTLAHEVAATLLAKRDLNGIDDVKYVTKEMIKAAEIYQDHVYSFGCHPSVDSLKLHIEEKLEILEIHPECFGTPDAWFYDEKANSLHVWDFKYGFAPIEALENWQLIAYMSGAAAKILDSHHLGNTFLADYHEMECYFHIVQPRAHHSNGPIRTWQIEMTEVLKYVERARERVTLAFEPYAPLTPGVHCGNCRARHACPAFQERALKIGESFSGQIPTEVPAEFLGSELSFLKQAQKVLDTRVNTLTAYAETVLKEGKSVQGYKLKKRFSRARWKPAHYPLLDHTKIGLSCIPPSTAVKLGYASPEIIEMSAEYEYLGDRLVEDNNTEINWEEE